MVDRLEAVGDRITFRYELDRVAWFTEGAVMLPGDVVHNGYAEDRRLFRVRQTADRQKAALGWVRSALVGDLTYDGCGFDSQYRSLELFQSLLRPETLRHWSTNGWVQIVGSAGGVYRIYPGFSNNVFMVDEEELDRVMFCAYPLRKDKAPCGCGWAGCIGGYGLLPVFDSMAAQMLAIETDEKYWHTVAVYDECCDFVAPWRRKLGLDVY